MKKIAAAIVVALLGGIVLIGFALGKGQGKPVAVEQLGRHEIQPSILASGRIVHEDEVRLTSEVIGKIKAVHVVEGQAVQQGDLVLSIDDEAYAAQVEQNRAAVRLQEIDIQRKQLAIENLQRQYERSRSLFNRSLLDAHAFDVVSHQLEAANIDLASARELLAQAGATLTQSTEQLDKTQVRSPIAGIVTSLDIEAGETAITSTTNIPGSELMVIADPQSIRAEVYVDEADISEVRVGQRVEVVAVAYAEQPVAGEVEFIANTAKYQAAGRGLSFRVRLRMDRTALGGVRLRSGMSCRVRIFVASGSEPPAVPIRAIVSEEEREQRTAQHFVYVFDGDEGHDVDAPGVVRKVSVDVGRSDTEFQEVVAGLDGDEFVVVGPARTLRHLRDGEAVRVADAEDVAGLSGL